MVLIMSSVLPSVGLASDDSEKLALTLMHSSQSDQVVQFAVSELRHYLVRVFPVTITIQVADTLRPYELHLHIGDLKESAVQPLEWSKRLRPIKPCHRVVPGVDAFLWRTGNGGLSLAGTGGRSLLYGVYDVLEKAADCGFCTLNPEDEVVPRRPAANLRVWLDGRKESFEQAAFSFRGRWYTNEGAGEVRNEKVSIERLRREVDWFAKSRDNVFILDNWSYTRHEDIWTEIRRQVFPELVRRGIIVDEGLAAWEVEFKKLDDPR